MDKAGQEILVFPRQCISTSDRFVPEPRMQRIVECIQKHGSWMPREEAERSEDVMQPISCALIRSLSSEYLVLRRVRETRADLRERISLISGGHVDRPLGDGNSAVAESISSLLLITLRRELDEGLGIRGVAESEIMPVGLVIDHTSVAASRHVAFVYEAVVVEEVRARAPEEFSLRRSKSNGVRYTAEALSEFHRRFDPWSMILFEDFVASSSIPKTPQQIEIPGFF